MRSRLRLLAAGLTAFLLVPALATVPSVAQDDPSQAQQQYEDALNDEAQVRQAYDAAMAKQFQLAQQLQTLDVGIAFAQTQLDSAQATFDEANQRAEATQARLDDTKARLAEEEQRFRDQAIAAYVGGGMEPMATFNAALKSDSIQALAESKIYSSTVVTNRKKVVDDFLALRDEVQQLSDQVDQERDEAQAARDEVAAHVADLASQRDQRVQSQQEAEQAAADAQSLFGELELRRRDYELRYAELSTQSDSIRELLAKEQKGQLPAETTFGIFLNPIKNGKVVSGYGMRMHPILGIEKMHTGLDLDGNMGDPMRASADGVVVIADERGGYGNTVVVDHGNQLATLYGHMSSFAVKAGDVVKRGDVLGTVGSTGMSTGPHCHWEVRVLGVPVDGTPYLSTAPE